MDGSSSWTVRISTWSRVNGLDLPRRLDPIQTLHLHIKHDHGRHSPATRTASTSPEALDHCDFAVLLYQLTNTFEHDSAITGKQNAQRTGIDMA
jgi:hypothetical protein